MREKTHAPFEEKETERKEEERIRETPRTGGITRVDNDNMATVGVIVNDEMSLEGDYFMERWVVRVTFTDSEP